MYLKKYIHAFIVLVFISGYYTDVAFRQEAAKVIYKNEKYLKDVSIFTYRLKRNSPYLTSVNGTTMQPWGNNITVLMEFNNMKDKSETYVLEAKLCEILKMDWVKEFVNNFSDVVIKKCPISGGTYHFYGFELPPKNFPLPFSRGDYHFKVFFVITSTREKVGQFEVNLRFQSKTG